MKWTIIPYWFAFSLMAIPTAWLWHRDRQLIRPGCCLRCGYDLTGNISGTCSECGEKAAPASEMSRDDPTYMTITTDENARV